MTTRNVVGHHGNTSMDETTTSIEPAPVTPDASTTPETPPAGATDRRFTQAEVEAIVKERVARVKTSAPQAAPLTPPAPAGKVTLESLQAELAESNLRIAFEKRASKLRIPDEESEDLFELYRGKPAASRDTWLEEKAKRLMPTQATSPVTTTAATAGAELKPAAAPNTPGRVDPITSGGLVDIWNLTPQQLSDLGPAGLRVEFEKHLSAGDRMSGRPPRPKAPQR